MESKPSRANWRISSRWSQGFFARLRRSTRWALVSFKSGIGGYRSLSSVANSTSSRLPAGSRRYKNRPKGRPLPNRGEIYQPLEKQKAHVPDIWHVGFEAETSKRARFGSTSGQMSVADSNSGLPRCNNRSGKSCACSKRLRGGDCDVNPGSAANIGCLVLGIWIHGGESESRKWKIENGKRKE